MATRGYNPAFSKHQDSTTMVMGYVGAGAADLSLESTDPTTSYYLSVRDNYDSFSKSGATTVTGSRQAVGVYLLMVKDLLPLILEVDASIHNSSGTGLRIQVIGWNTNKAAVTLATFSVPQGGILVKVSNIAGADAAADPTSSDHIRLTVRGRSSRVVA